MSPPPPAPLRSPYPLLTAAIALLTLSALLAIHTALRWHHHAALQAEVTFLRDERRTLDNQLKQLRREYLDKENALRTRERELSSAEQERLTDELTRLRREQRRLELASLAESLQSSLRTTANNPNIEVLSETDRFLIRFPETVLFNPSETSLSRSGESLLSLLKPHWSGPWQSTTTEIHVHTDTSPPPPALRTRFPSNWEWTAARAGSIARFLESLDPLIAHSFRAVGLGSAQAETDQPPAVGPRRVDLIILFP